MVVVSIEAEYCSTINSERRVGEMNVFPFQCLFCCRHLFEVLLVVLSQERGTLKFITPYFMQYGADTARTDNATAHDTTASLHCTALYI